MQLSQSYQAYASALNIHLNRVLEFDPTVPHAPVLEAMAYGTLGSGKRLRGVMALVSGDFHGANRQQSLTLAAAIECLHAYSLIHDDLPALDQANMRRGKPSVHKAFNEAIALLAGDGLQALAFELAAEACLSTKGVGAFAKAVGRHGMVGGQMQDMLAEAGVIVPTLANLKALHVGKTGALIQFSALAGVYLSDEDRHVEALSTYGSHVGLAFQIWDDVLDVVGEAALTGKPQGHDAAKMTFTNLFGLNRAKAEARRLVAKAKAILPPGHFSGILQEIADFAVNRVI